MMLMLLNRTERSMQRLLRSILAPGSIHLRRLCKLTSESARVVFRQNHFHLPKG
jgi:hypothetical protein